jgi:transcriptional regulator with XRE-family HTH domain
MFVDTAKVVVTMSETVSMRLRWAREAAGLSCRELSTLAKLGAPTHVALIESETRGRVAASTLVQLADVLGVSLDWLAAGKGTRPDEEMIRRSVERARRAKTGTDG